MQFESSDFEQILLNVMKCPVCTEYMVPPITLCVNGHNICGICKPKLDVCPTCRELFLVVNNEALEKLAREVKYPCTYRQFGCKEVLALYMLVEHQAKCPNGKLTCPAAQHPLYIQQCDWTGDYKEVKNHLLEKHLEMCVDYGVVESRTLHAFSTLDGFHKFVFFYDEVFFRTADVINNIPCVVVQYIGPPDKAAKYQYKVKLVNKDNTEGVAVMHLTRSFDEYLDDVFHSENCGKLQFDEVNRPEAQKGDLKFKLEILKVGN
jgi:E3 ubiquitin-protein ligase SIAH1